MSRAALLSQQEFDALLVWLAPCREQAGEKYEAIRRTLRRFFESQKCGAEDDHVDETIDRVARRIAAGEVIRSTPHRYFRGVAKKISLECFRRRARMFKLQLLAPDVPEHSHERETCLDECLRLLPAPARELLEGYYLGNRAVLAATLGITPNALRLRVFKERRRLRACIARRLGDDGGCAAGAEISSLGSPLRGEASEQRC